MGATIERTLRGSSGVSERAFKGVKIVLPLRRRVQGTLARFSRESKIETGENMVFRLQIKRIARVRHPRHPRGESPFSKNPLFPTGRKTGEKALGNWNLWSF